MRLSIYCVGRVKSAPELDLCAMYRERAQGLGKRLGFSGVEIAAIDTSREGTPAARMADEARQLAAKLPAAAHHIALDGTGRQLPSEALARHLGKLRDGGVRDTVFLIGGPDGLSPKLKESAAELLSLGAQTWPHLLVRAMLAEQIYRSFSILAGHPYHRGATR